MCDVPRYSNQKCTSQLCFVITIVWTRLIKFRCKLLQTVLFRQPLSIQIEQVACCSRKKVTNLPPLGNTALSHSFIILCWHSSKISILVSQMHFLYTCLTGSWHQHWCWVTVVIINFLYFSKRALFDNLCVVEISTDERQNKKLNSNSTA